MTFIKYHKGGSPDWRQLEHLTIDMSDPVSYNQEILRKDEMEKGGEVQGEKFLWRRIRTETEMEEIIWRKKILLFWRINRGEKEKEEMFGGGT